jgi:DNA-binding XRE family transcriptional regulator
MTAEELEAWRIRAGLPITHAARLLGVSTPTYRKWEKDGYPIPSKVDEAVKKSASYLAKRKPEASPGGLKSDSEIMGTDEPVRIDMRKVHDWSPRNEKSSCEGMGGYTSIGNVLHPLFPLFTLSAISITAASLAIIFTCIVIICKIYHLIG